MLRAVRVLAALALVSGLSAPASALVVDFSAVATPGIGEVTFAVSLDQPTSIIGYEFWIQYDADELQWNSYSELSGLISVTPLPGNAQHLPGGMKAVAVSFSGAVTASDLFSISFLIVNPISDGAFDDFRIFHAPEGCALLPDGCNRVPPACDTGADASCDDLNPTDFLASSPPGAYEKGNLGFEFEIGLDPVVEGRALGVPEPSLALLMLGALLPLASRRR